jgi:hypothetical protein
MALAAAVALGPPAALAAEPPAVEWSRIYGGNQGDSFDSVVACADGGALVAGLSYSARGDTRGNRGEADIWVLRLNAGGGIVWKRSLGGRGFDYVDYAAETSDGGFLLAGGTNTRNGDFGRGPKPGPGGGSDAWAMLMDAGGGTVWIKSYGGAGEDGAGAVLEDPAGGYLLVGWSSSAGVGRGCGPGPGGASLWALSLGEGGAPGGGECLATPWPVYRPLAVRSGGGALAVANGAEEDGGGALFTAEVGPGPSFGGLKRLEGGPSPRASAAAPLRGGGLLAGGCAGYSSDGNGSCQGALLLRTAPDGSTAFMLDPDAVPTADLRGVARSKGGYLAAGTAKRRGTGGKGRGAGGEADGDLLALMVSDAGEVLWKLAMGGSGEDGASSLAVYPDGGMVAAGYTSSWDGDLAFRGRPNRPDWQNATGWVVKIAPSAQAVQGITATPESE